MKGQQKIDEFALILLAVFIFMGILMITWTTPAEFPPKVEPSSVSLSLKDGTSTSFDMNISGKITLVNISVSGQVSKWIKFSKNDFDVIAGSVITTGTLSVPKNTAAGTYKGIMTVSSVGGKKEVPINVDVLQISRIASRSIDLGGLTLGFSGATAVESKESASVVKGYFYGKDFDMAADVDEKNLNILNSADLKLDIFETNGYGNIVVIFNGEEVYNGKAAAGELSIPIDGSLVRKSNTIKIKATDPGFFFWANTVYNIRLAKFSINMQGAFSEDLDFVLNSDEISGFDHFQLTYKVEDYTSPVPDLTVAINSQKIFSGRPELTLFNRNFATDSLGRKFEISGSNKLAFSFDQKAFYGISNVILTVFYGV